MRKCTLLSNDIRMGHIGRMNSAKAYVVYSTDIYDSSIVVGVQIMYGIIDILRTKCAKQRARYCGLERMGVHTVCATVMAMILRCLFGIFAIQRCSKFQLHEEIIQFWHVGIPYKYVPHNRTELNRGTIGCGLVADRKQELLISVIIYTVPYVYILSIIYIPWRFQL